MKKYLFLAVALLGLASCTKDDIADGNNPIHGGEVEISYIAINLSASDITRAQTGFDDGEAAERAVSHADFFFFDEKGDPFSVTNSNTPGYTPGTTTGGVNHLRATDVVFVTDTNNGDDISDTSSNPVLLLSTYKGQYPSQIVAVLNWSPDNAKSYSLKELHDAAVNITDKFEGTDYFVMSNAVYAQGTNEVCATPLTMENIKTTANDAKNAPVNIYVERIAAKVKINTNDKYDLNEIVSYLPDGETETIKGGVYAKILGWDLYRDNSQSHLLKNIDPSWTDAEMGFTWNDAPWYRCYWAESLTAPTNDEIYNSSTAFNAGNHTYIGENTTGKATCTKAVIKAELVTTVEGVDKPLEIAIWNNVEYVDEASENNKGYSLRVAVANTLKNTYFALTEESDGSKKYTGLQPEDLQCVAGGTAVAPQGVKANEVYFQLSTTGQGKNWHKLVNGQYVTMDGHSNTNEALKSVPAAVLYKNGETFYYVDIAHLGNLSNNIPEAGDYGIVRNHIYNVTINSIKGYGSPVYTGTEFIDYPQITDQNSFVSAQINILSWRLVNQTVDIQPNN